MGANFYEEFFCAGGLGEGDGKFVGRSGGPVSRIIDNNSSQIVQIGK